MSRTLVALLLGVVLSTPVFAAEVGSRIEPFSLPDVHGQDRSLAELADKPNTNNLTGFKNKRADEIMDAEQVTFDQAARVKMLRELDSILMDSKQYALAWYAPYTRIAFWNKFGHPNFYLGKISDFEGVLSTWWYDPEKAEIVAKGRSDKSVKMDVPPADVTFWPDYNKQHPVQTSNAAAGSAAAPAAGDSSQKPSLK